MKYFLHSLASLVYGLGLFHWYELFTFSIKNWNMGLCPQFAVNCIKSYNKRQIEALHRETVFNMIS